MKLLYVVRKAKAKRTGLAPLYARLQMKGQKTVEFSTGIFILPKQWDPHGNGHIKGNDRLTDVYNHKLTEIRAEVISIHSDLERRGKRCTPSIVKSLYTGELKERATLIQAMTGYIQHRAREPELSRSTISNFGRQMKNVQRFLANRKDMKILCSEVNVRTLAKLDEYLRTEMKFKQVYCNRIIGFVKTVMDYAVLQEWIEFNSLNSYKYRRAERKKKVYLTQDELQRLIDHKFASWRLGQVAELFIFQCFTGLSYAELMHFDRSWIGVGVDTQEWIFADRQKVHGAQCEIPLFATAKNLLIKWNYKVPELDNQQYNRYLKEVAFLVGIDKHLTTHVGRKTFGNILQENGVSIESISGMYGHADTRMTRSYYVDVSAVKVAKETEAIRNL
ncbi:site-specific integrase [Catalinimonas niigatensis]|uniref:site-specific integrase n=1 Tax=Catalinimonas niigatensis TaxID=1397264 RepID=UPI0026653267|nr:site-specific integrase [Catalinimonas niigatensis]WPP49673.1 tyrosine-type recombinase/integrase [Catalinimonas niigatensis]